LDHETGETLECTGNANGGVDFDQDTLGGVDEDLQAASLVDGGVEEGEKALKWREDYMLGCIRKKYDLRITRHSEQSIPGE
jgi:hypothetical protein